MSKAIEITKTDLAILMLFTAWITAGGCMIGFSSSIASGQAFIGILLVVFGVSSILALTCPRDVITK